MNRIVHAEQQSTALYVAMDLCACLYPTVTPRHSLEGFSLWKLRREMRFLLQTGCQLVRSLQPTYNSLCLLLRWHPCSSTQGQAIIHRHCHALRRHPLNQVDRPLPCCSSSLRICQNLTSPHLSHPPSFSSC